MNLMWQVPKSRAATLKSLWFFVTHKRWPVLFREIVAGYSQKHVKQKYTVLVKRREFIVRTASMQYHHCFLNSGP
jgi:hypothetical protein